MEQRPSDTTNQPTTSNTTTAKKLITDFDNLEFDALAGSYYHNARRAFLTNVHRVIMFTVVILGTAAFGDVITGYQQWFIMASVVIATFDLVFNTSHKARDHDVLYSRFTTFLGVIKSQEPTAKNVMIWKRELHQIWASEPPVLEALQTLSHNKVSIMKGKKKWVIPVNWFRRMFKNFFNFPHIGANKAKTTN